MADIDLKTETPDASINDSAILFGADSQASANPSVYSVATVRSHFVGAGTLNVASGKTLTASNTLTLAGTDGTTMTFPTTSATLARTDAGNTFTGAQTFSVGTVNGTGLDLTQTWGGTGTYTGLRYNVTDSGPSNAASLLMDLQVGGSSRFRVDKNGVIVNPRTNYYDPIISPSVGSTAGLGINANGLWATSAGVARISLSWTEIAVSVGSNGKFQWSPTTDVASGADLILTRRGAANLRLGAADAAGSAISVSSVASNQITLASNHGLSNGAAVQVTFTAGGAVPAGTAVNTTYYARSISAAVLELYDTYQNAVTTASTTGRVSVTTAGTTAFINRATPFQTFSVQSFTGTDIPGQPFVITGSQGTGTGRGGDIIFQVAPAGTTGSTQNALATALTINASSQSIFSDGTAALPSVVFSSDTGMGIFRQALGQIGFAVSGASRAALLSNQFRLGGISLSFAPTDATSGADTFIVRDDANKLALRNGTNAQEQRVYGSFTSATNFQRMSIKTLRESSGALSGATYVSTIAIPAYAVPIGVTTRVTTAITGATSYDVGDGTDADLWGNDIDITLGSQSRTADFTAIAAVDAAATARTVTLTANGSNFTGGVVEICVHYLTTEAD